MLHCSTRTKLKLVSGRRKHLQQDQDFLMPVERYELSPLYNVVVFLFYIALSVSFPFSYRVINILILSLSLNNFIPSFVFDYALSVNPQPSITYSNNPSKQLPLPKKSFQAPEGWAFEGDWYIAPEMRSALLIAQYMYHNFFLS